MCVKMSTYDGLVKKEIQTQISWLKCQALVSDKNGSHYSKEKDVRISGAGRISDGLVKKGTILVILQQRSSPRARVLFCEKLLVNCL